MKKLTNILILTLLVFTICSFTSNGQETDNIQVWNNSFTYMQKLNYISKQEANGMIIRFSDIDSANCIADINLNFHFSEKCISVFLQNLSNSNTSSLKNALSNNKKKITYNTTFLFKSVKLNWNIQTNSFMSTDTLVLYKLNGNILNKNIIGRIELSSEILFSKFNLFFKVNKDDYYYFQYNKNILNAISTSIIFNELIINTNLKARTVKGQKGFKNYYYTIGTEYLLKNFLRKIEHDNWL